MIEGDGFEGGGGGGAVEGEGGEEEEKRGGLSGRRVYKSVFIVVFLPVPTVHLTCLPWRWLQLQSSTSTFG